jgi:hypothetical protein
MQSGCRSGAAAVVVLALAFVASCGADDAGGRGSVAIRVSGEGAAKTGFPYVRDGVQIAFVDGWSLRFTKYLASVGDLRLISADDRVAFESSSVYVVDLHLGDPTIATFGDLPARRWERFGFRVVAPPADAIKVGLVDDADLGRMQAGGFNYWVEGTAEKEGATYSFAWGLQNPSRASNCTSGVDGTDGIVVRNNTTTVAEITFHLDHLFWDTLGTEQNNLRFEAIAAASQDDTIIEWDELATQPLADLRGRDGGRLVDESGRPVVYNPGSIPLAAPTLQAFMLATAAGQAHLDGLGLCTVSRL